MRAIFFKAGKVSAAEALRPCGLGTGYDGRHFRCTAALMTAADFRALVVFDLDGTLLRGPTVCEVIAQSLGRLPRMQEFERLRDRQQIAAARHEMALWYREASRASILDSLQNVQWAPGLAEGIARLQAGGFAVGIASITWRFAVQYFADKWGIEHCLATTLHEVGTIDHVWPEHKAEWLLELSERLGIPRARTAAVGDSAGDYEMLGVANTSIFVGRELPPRQQNWIHWPAADIEQIASHLLNARPLQPAQGM